MNIFNDFRKTMIVVLFVGVPGFATNVIAQTDIEKKNTVEKMVSEFSASVSVPEIEAAGALGLLVKKDIIFVDVRNSHEIKVSTIPGAITKKYFEEHQGSYKDSNIITFCTIGYRSAKYAEHWNKKGFHMRNLRGSLLLWSHAGGPLVDSAGKPTRRVYVNAKKWNLVPSSYQGVY